MIDSSSTVSELLREVPRLYAWLLLEKSWGSRGLDRLAQCGLVSKEPNPAGARSRTVALTAAGKLCAQELNAMLDGCAEQLLASLSDRDRKEVNHTLLVLLKVLRKDTSATYCLPVPERKESSCR